MRDKNILPIVRKGDLIQVQWHTFDTARALTEVQRRAAIADNPILIRQAGLYRVTFVFNHGNVFAIPVGSSRDNSQQVIEPKYVIGKVDERRAA